MPNRIYPYALIALLLVPSFAGATPVVVGEHEWRQLTDTTNFSWNDVATVCDPDSGACSGMLGEVDFDGWTWGSINDVGSLLAELTPHSGAPDERYFERDNIWGPAFFELFSPTYEESSLLQAWGWTRTPMVFIPDLGAFAPMVSHRSGSRPRSGVQTDAWGNYEAGYPEVGVWLYRDVAATAAPESGSFALIGLGLVALAGVRRSRRYRTSD